LRHHANKLHTSNYYLEGNISSDGFNQTLKDIEQQ